MKMPGKKRKLKKELKRKLRKDIKKKDNKDMKVDKSKVEKQVIDNQTLQQIMLAQMLASRDRVRKGEDTSWITTQNQSNADKIQYQQKINALKTEKQEWERKAKNIEENEKYKELIEKYEQEVENNKKAVEQLQKIVPLEEEIRELNRIKEELEQKLNNPVIQKEREIENAKNYIKHMKETLDAKDPDFKKLSDKIAKQEALLKKYKKQQELSEELDRLKTEVKRKESERKSAMEYLRKEFPEELKGVQWNATDLDTTIQNLIDDTVAKIAENEATLKKYKEQQQVSEEYGKTSKEFKHKQAEMKADMEYVRQQVPDVLTGVAWNAKDRDEKILEAKHKITIDIDNINKQLEILKETSKEMEILNQVKANRDMYEKNFKRQHPLFVPIYEEKLSKYGENITLANRTEAFDEAITEYKADLITNQYTIENDRDKVNKIIKFIEEGYDLPDKSSSDDSDFDMEEYHKSHSREDGSSSDNSEANMTPDRDIKKKGYE